MTRLGYGHVTEQGFTSFSHDLTEGAWQTVVIQAFDNADRMLLADPSAVSLEVAWKLRATWAIATLRDALGASSEVLTELDARWDSTQRKLFYALSGAREERDPAVQAAASRLAGALLEGKGTAQTLRSYEDEVDFGRHQVHLMRHTPLSADVALLGLEPLRDQIDQDTEALARGLGRGPGEQRSKNRYKRVRAAITACAAEFNGIHGDIAWMVARMPPGAARTRLERLLAPFQSLLERYRAPAGAEPEVEPEEPIEKQAAPVEGVPALG